MAGAQVPNPQTLIVANQGDALTNAAKKYNIPFWVLDGVWGLETDFGKNVATSSAGAMGDFQFIPSTAKQFGYPMTNTPTDAQFQQQADDAAEYLSQLYNAHGKDWNNALLAYSDGGYGAAQVQAKAKGTPVGESTSVSIPNPVTAVGNAASDAVSAALGPIGSAISDVWTSAVNDMKYGAVLVGVLAVAVFLITRMFSGSGSKTVVPVPV